MVIWSPQQLKPVVLPALLGTPTHLPQMLLQARQLPRPQKLLPSTKNLSHFTTPLDMRLISITISVLTLSGSPNFQPSSLYSRAPAPSAKRSITHSLTQEPPLPMANAKLMNSKALSQMANQHQSVTAAATSKPAPATTECSSTRAPLSKCSWTKQEEKESPLPAETTALCITAHTVRSPEATRSRTSCSKIAMVALK